METVKYNENYPVIFVKKKNTTKISLGQKEEKEQH